MKRSEFTEEQIAFALRQAVTGTRVAEVCRKMGISEQTYFRALSSGWSWTEARRSAFNVTTAPNLFPAL